ncbi:MAG TPA: ATP-binding protein [Candidatus Bathyarchaeia archaeon]|nr:ATP-binding protein [Candidatus Bathyarchaeia archaeon]
MTDAPQQTPLHGIPEGDRLSRLLVESSFDVFAIFDLEGRPLYVSPSGYHLRGYTAEEAMRQTQEERLTPRSREVARQALAEGLAVERAGQTPPNSFRRLELEQPCKDGSTVWVESTFTWIRDETRRPVGILSVTRDISARRRAEADLAESQLQLREAQKLEAVGRLAGGIAHEFNNLMTIILGRAQWLLSLHPDDETLRPQLQMIERAGQRAAHLTAQLVAFCRRQSFAPRRLDLSGVVRDAVPALRRLLPRGIELITRLAERLPPVEADRMQLEHVLRQLTLNARDAMPAGGRLTIETAEVARAGAHSVLLSVVDTGVGMDDEVRGRAFEPFFTTKEVGDGTGLGLAMVYGSVLQHGGRIELDSLPGVGATVRMLLPAAGADPADADRLPQGLPTVPPTILIVEDHRATADRLASALRGQGYTLLTSPSAEEALAVAAAHRGPIDLLVTGVMLAGLNGGELAARLQRDRPGLRTLFVVEDVVEPDPRLVLRAPERWLVQRIFSPESLLEKVAHALAGRDAPAR